MSIELNIDGLVGPTHNYAGLSFGNVASHENKGLVANPRAAALQGLKKMRSLVSLGVPQAVMPPHERPFVPVLRQLGFSGSSVNVVSSAWKNAPTLMTNLTSASSMWTANAATVSPSVDCVDGKVHFTPANLVAMPHRSFEPASTRRLLKTIFSNEDHFVVHDPLPSNNVFGDEGAANHNRMADSHGSRGLEIFIYGRQGFDTQSDVSKFPGRQTAEASEAIARVHQLSDSSTMIWQQNPDVIAAGAFHNDVVCVTNGPVILYHEKAFRDLPSFKEELKRKAGHLGFAPFMLEASNQQMSLEDAIGSYIFNSQIITLDDGSMTLILPAEAETTPSAFNFVEQCIAGDNPIKSANYLDLGQSMRNGGGPACLRLRVQLTDEELKAIHQPVLMDFDKISNLERWVTKHYRDRLAPEDLADPNLVLETQTALDELTKILKLGSFYHFQYDQTPHWSEYA